MIGLETLEFRDRLGRRLIRCVIGLSLFSFGISLQMNANIGAPPWDVFHQGIAKQTDISIGKIIVLTGFSLLLLWIPVEVIVLVTGWLLGGQVGVATFAFAFGVGPLVHFFLPRLAVKKPAV